MSERHTLMSILKSPAFRRPHASAADVFADIPEDDKPVIFDEVSEEPPSVISQLPCRRGLTTKQYWESVIDDIETLVRCSDKERIPLIDYSLVLPPRLKQQVKKIMPYEFSEEDNIVFIKEHLIEEKAEDFAGDEEEEDEKKDNKNVVELRARNELEAINESEFSDIVRLDNEFERYDLKLDEPVSHAVAVVDKRTWMAKYICGSRAQRVIWNSRIHKKAYTMLQKTLDEQAEDLMDTSAERFIEWLNGVGNTDECGMTVQKLKELFSIKGDRTLLASIKTDPKEVNAIAKTVADKWGQPQMAIELQYETYINERVNRKQKPRLISVFGRTVSAKDKPWMKSSTDVPIDTVFPEELLSREKIFKGIRHLRSTHALIDFYRKHPQLKRPRYLVQSGDFQAGFDHAAKGEIPLYEYLGLKY